MKASSRRMVIDASVARAAGTTIHPVSSACRTFLESLRTICHRVVTCPELANEWNKHQSRFFKIWRSSMVSRKKLSVETVEGVWGVARAIPARGSSTRQEKELKKDEHLIALALGTDGIVISLDDTARGCWSRLGAKNRTIGEIMWVNPADSTAQPIEWLQRGAPRERARQLAG